MASSYPGALDALTNPGASDPMNAPSHSGQHANANDAIEAIEAELGVTPSSSYATVAARLTAIEAALAGGLTLITPTSVAGSGVSLTGARVDLAAASTCSVNGVFTSTFDNYLVVVSLAIASGAAVYTNIRLRAAGTDAATASTYVTQESSADSTTTSASRSTSDKSRLMVVGAAYPSAFTFDVFGPAVAAATRLAARGYYGYNNASLAQAVAVHTPATAYDGFTVYPDSSTLTGKIRVYGYQN